MNSATVRRSVRRGRKERTLTGFRIMLSMCLCAVILTSLSAARAESEPAPSYAALSQKADQDMKAMEEEAIRARQEKFEAYYTRAKEYHKRSDYARALVAVEKALEIRPDAEGAGYLLRRILDSSDKERNALLREAVAGGMDEAMVMIEQEGIIPQDIITYDLNTWRDVRMSGSERLGRGVRGGVVNEWEAGLRKKLEQRVSFDFKDSSLTEITDYLRKLAKVDIVIDPRARIGNTPITLPADNVSLESALNLICRFAEAKWSMADKMIYISDRIVSDEPTLAIYPVTDLIIPVRDFMASDRPSLFRTVASSRTVKKENGLDVGISYPGGRRTEIDLNQQGRDLCEFIKKTIGTGTWAEQGEAGAGANTIQFQNGRLAVNTSPRIHDQVIKLLESFRKARTVQITVQTRFIEIEKNFLEEIGVDWTGLEGGLNTINPAAQHTPIDADSGAGVPIARGMSSRGNGGLDEFGNPWWTGYQFVDGTEDMQGLPAGYDAIYGTIPDDWRRNPVPDEYWNEAGDLMPARRPSGQLDIGMANINELGMSVGDINAGFTNDGGLLLDLAYLSTFQVRMLLNAVIKHRKGNVLTQPRLTCFNGERANIAITTEVSYMRNIAEGLPDIGFITDGIVFEVVPYASADRRYITLELLPTLRVLTRPIREQTISLPEELDDGGVVWTSTNLQLPEVSVRCIETFASVPDGGTLLLGGLSRVAEGEGRAGVPIIDDIPVLRFFFSRWGKSDVRTSLIILVRADVLIQGEHEPNVGPAS